MFNSRRKARWLDLLRAAITSALALVTKDFERKNLPLSAPLQGLDESENVEHIRKRLTILLGYEKAL